MVLLDHLLLLSLPSQIAVAIFALSVFRIVYIIVAGVLRAVLRLLRVVLPAPRAKPKASRAQASAADEYQLGTPARPEQKPGVSMRKLLEEQRKAKGKQAAGQDRHAHSKLFLSTLKGHTDVVNGVSFSADGLLLATACDDRCMRVFNLAALEDASGKPPGFKACELRKMPADVGFGTDSSHVAVMTRGMVSAAGVMMLNVAPKDAETEWEREGVLGGLEGSCMRSAHSSKGGYGILLCCSKRTMIRVLTTKGQDLGAIDTGGIQNYTAALSRDGRFVAAATFTSDVKVYEVGHDRLGAFTGIKKVMDLKGHKSKVKCLDFSPDLTKMVTASEDGTLKIWNINVRYHMDEDPKILLSAGLPLLPNRCYQLLAWGHEGFIAAVYGTSIHFIDSRTGEVVEKIEAAHDHQITCLEWSPVKIGTPQGKASVLASSSNDNRVRLWRGPERLV